MLQNLTWKDERFPISGNQVWNQIKFYTIFVYVYMFQSGEQLLKLTLIILQKYRNRDNIIN